MSSIVTVSGVSFELANGRSLFSNLNFSLERQVTALVGPNGIGKTCLARLLAGDLEPHQGIISRGKELKYFPQWVRPTTASVEDFLGSEYEWSALGQKLLEGVDRQAPCVTLSGGQWMRVRLAQTTGNLYLILDEPTNNLDHEGRQALIRFLKHHSSGCLLISHDREALALCQDVIELSNHGLFRFGGGWAAYEEAKKREREKLEDAMELAKRERDKTSSNRQEKIEKQERRNRQGASNAKKGGLPKILMGGRKRKAQTTLGQIDASTLETANEAVRDAHSAFTRLKVDPVMYADSIGIKLPQQKLVVEARDFNIFFGSWLYPRDLTFTWRGNIRLSLRGANGSGKSSLLNAFTGQALTTKGELRVGSLTTLYLDQQCAVLDDSLSIFENIQQVCILEESAIRNGLAKFLFTKEMVFQKVETLSGGERLRASLAKGFLNIRQPELLILDEPTNNLDPVNVRFLENLIHRFQGAVIAVSHDETFLRNCGITEIYSIPSKR